MSTGGAQTLADHRDRPFYLPRDEMAFRGRYEALLLQRAITTVFRPGDRTWPNWRGYRQGEVVTARVIDTCGDDASRTPPRFNAVRLPIRLTEVLVLDVDRLAPPDFDGSSPDVVDRPSLLAHLQDIYGKSIDAFDRRVTRIRFTYEDRRF